MGVSRKGFFVSIGLVCSLVFFHALPVGRTQTTLDNLQLVTNAPASGTFYLLSAELTQPLPPYPFDPYAGAMPVYGLTGFPDSFLIADSPEDYVTLRTEQSFQMSGRMSTMSAEAPPSPGEGGGTNEWCCAEVRAYGSNDLWLEIAATNGATGGGVARVMASFTIHTPTSAAYDLFATTNLTTNVAGLNLTNWLWLGRIEAELTNVLVETYWPDMAFFQLGTTNDSDGDGLSDAYERLVSHTNPGTPSSVDTDGDGLPDWWEIAHGLNPYVNDAGNDPDGDGLTNVEEFNNHSDPWSGSMVVAWGRNNGGQCNVPPSLRDVVAVAGGEKSSYALKADGRVIGWGGTTTAITNVLVALTNATRIAANGYGSCSTPTGFGLALSNGVVIQWGTTLGGALSTNGVREIAAGAFHALALMSNGHVVAWGNTDQWAAKVPASLSNVTAIATGWHHGVALLSNGTVMAWGLNNTNLGYTLTDVPTALSNNVVAISAYGLHSLALRNDGKVTAWGYNQCGQTNVPDGLNNVVAVAAGAGHNLALKADGTVTTWGVMAAAPAGLDKVTAIASGQDHCLAVRTGRLTPVIVTPPANRRMTNGGNVSFTVQAASLATPSYQWQFNGADLTGQTSATLNRVNIATNQTGNYRVVVCNGAGCVTSAVASLDIVVPSSPIVTNTTPPAPGVVWLGTTSVLQVGARAEGEDFVPLSFQWYRNGVVLTNQSLPFLMLSGATAGDSYNVIVSNALGSTNVGPWLVRKPEAGGIVAWGDNYNGQAEPPTAITNIVALAGGYAHSVALTDDGHVYAWGGNQHGQTNVPLDLTNATAIACGNGHTLALKADGTLAVWGRTNYGLWNIPPECTNVVKIAAGGLHNLVLLQDGSLREWGTNYGPIPATATNITAIASGYDFDLALRGDGTVVAWGYPTWGQTNVPGGLTNVVAIAAGEHHALALKRDGRVVAWGTGVYGETNVPADLTNVMAIAANAGTSMALRNDGKVRVWGPNHAGQTNVMVGLPPVKVIGAGGGTPLVALYSSLVQYPVDVTKDLLLIYNANSLDSSNVCAYYLAHRPMVSQANLLPIGCTNTESFLPSEYTNVFVPQIGNWLANNPTKRPQYVILFLDIPSRVNTNRPPLDLDVFNRGALASVSYLLATQFSGWQPFVTHLNMGTTNDCRAYIDKLEYFGTTYSPGALVISANGAGDFGNTNINYVLDGIRHGGNYTNGVLEEGFPRFLDPISATTVSSATNGLLNAGVPTNSILFFDGLDIYTNNIPPPLIHPTSKSNIAGYMTWGAHSALEANYPTDSKVAWVGTNRWWIIETVESFNGQRESGAGMFIKWFSAGAFGGTNYSNTPVGAVTHVDEPHIPGVNNAANYFGLWASWKNFGIAAWNSRNTPYFQAVGDPLIKR